MVHVLMVTSAFKVFNTYFFNTLIPSDAPELKNNAEDIFVNEGDSVSLACGAEGNPLLFMWTCDGENMKVNTSNLNVTHVTTNINCTCTAYNHLGTVNKQIGVHVATSKWTSFPAAMPTPEPTADTGTVHLISTSVE